MHPIFVYFFDHFFHDKGRHFYTEIIINHWLGGELLKQIQN